MRFPVVVALALASAAPRASADEPCADDPRVCGRLAFDAGVQAFKDKNFPVALARFREAYAIQAHPIVVFNLALAEAESDLVLEALDHLAKLEQDPSAEPGLIEQVREETTRLSRVAAVIAVEVSSAREVVVEIDGIAVSPTGGVYRVNPGKHDVRVTADGKLALERAVTAERGERITLSVDRTREVVVEKDRTPTAVQDKPPGVTDSSGPSPAWFFVAGGATVVLGGVAVWSGLDTSAAKRDYDDKQDSLPRSEQQQLLDDGHSKETRTNILIGATAVGAVAATVLGAFVVDWGGGEGEARAMIGPGGVFVSGRF